MQDQDKTELQKWRAEFGPMLRKFVIGGVIAAAFTTGGSYAFGIKDNLVSLWNLPVAVAENSRQIQLLRIPRKIFEISDVSGPTSGYCVEGQNCSVNVRVRRYADALSCEINPETVEYYYRNPRTNEVHSVDIVSGRPRDVGTSWLNIPFVFSTPYGISPDAELCSQPEYTGCPGQSESDDAISQAPECFNVKVVQQ